MERECLEIELSAICDNEIENKSKQRGTSQVEPFPSPSHSLDQVSPPASFSYVSCSEFGASMLSTKRGLTASHGDAENSVVNHSTRAVPTSLNNVRSKMCKKIRLTSASVLVSGDESSDREHGAISAPGIVKKLFV